MQVAAHLQYQEQQIAEREAEIARLRAEIQRIKSQQPSADEAPAPDQPMATLLRYRDDLPGEIAGYARNARVSRRYSNILQWVIIVGSVSAAALTSAGAATTSAMGPRIAAAILSALVSIAAGLAGYYKFRERGFGQQLTADAIERHAKAALLRIGEYSLDDSEEHVLKQLATNIEVLKDEQRKRELQLEQRSEDRAAPSD